MAIDGIRAFRPLEQDPWLGDFETGATEIVGEGMLDFSGDRALGVQELGIIGAGKFLGLKYGPQKLEDINGEKLAEDVEANAPESFSLTLGLITTGDLGVTYIRDLNEDRRRVLIAGIHQARIVVGEQKELEGAVDEFLGVRPTRRPVLSVKLAVVNEGHSIDNRELQQMAYLLPEEMRARPGEIIPITIGPGSVVEDPIGIEEFNREVSINAAHDLAEAQTA